MVASAARASACTASVARAARMEAVSAPGSAPRPGLSRREDDDVGPIPGKRRHDGAGVTGGVVQHRRIGGAHDVGAAIDRVAGIGDRHGAERGFRHAVAREAERGVGEKGRQGIVRLTEGHHEPLRVHWYDGFHAGEAECRRASGLVCQRVATAPASASVSVQALPVESRLQAEASPGTGRPRQSSRTGTFVRWRANSTESAGAATATTSSPVLGRSPACTTQAASGPGTGVGTEAAGPAAAAGDGGGRQQRSGESPPERQSCAEGHAANSNGRASLPVRRFEPAPRAPGRYGGTAPRRPETRGRPSGHADRSGSGTPASRPARRPRPQPARA